MNIFKKIFGDSFSNPSEVGSHVVVEKPNVHEVEVVERKKDEEVLSSETVTRLRHFDRSYNFSYYHNIKENKKMLENE